VAYLRFCPEEYRALSALCRHLNLNDDGYNDFLPCLVGGLADTLPQLATRVARLAEDELLLLFEHFRALRVRSAPERLSDEEFEAIADVVRLCPSNHRFLRFVRRSLARHFRDTTPGLADKLAAMSDRQFERLYARARQHGSRGT
jgi:hypothetical protein